MPKGQERDLILIVEDDQDVSDMLCTYLQRRVNIRKYTYPYNTFHRPNLKPAQGQIAAFASCGSSCPLTLLPSSNRRGIVFLWWAGQMVALWVKL